MKSKPSEMSLVSSGLNAEEMNAVYGARCVCSSGSADHFSTGDAVCQCDGKYINSKANAKIAGIDISTW